MIEHRLMGFIGDLQSKRIFQDSMGKLTRRLWHLSG